ncbi:DUF6520 family protein [Pedobacter chitinilyticus]|uniref:Secreted protein n=1 Tax=Pedobacter chitinilyticus TaxID=2233776 RepID=A0A3S3PHB9_9SPHI|nr:DUF6520 family protein [Pedobacter chitinilyticus]RWU08151.1 hypothetical protein DPV69_07155 [Pedobacter chitinilyticus]
MKKNVMLGLFALLLAVGTAFATTKARTPQTVYYYQNETEKTGCTDDFLDIDCSPGDENCRRETTNDGIHQLYQLPGCVNPLDQETGF